MISAPWRASSIPLSDEDAEFLYRLADDTEDAPWMVMSTDQFWSIDNFISSVSEYRHRNRLPGFIASMLPIHYRQSDTRGRVRRKQLSPDTFLAMVDDHERSSYDLQAEGQPPSFVLEVVSPSSAGRDEHDKVRAYDLLGVREYALFTPGGLAGSTLKGYRRGSDGRFEPWLADDAGRLWSEALELRLVIRDGRLRAETRDGTLLRTLPEAEDAQQQEAAARRRAEEARQRVERVAQEERMAREQLKAELERVEAERAAERAELTHLRALLPGHDESIS